MDFKGLIRSGAELANRNSPKILTVCAVGGLIGTAVMTGRATLKAHDILEAEREKRYEKYEERREGESLDDISWPDKVKLCWKPYISPCLMGVTSVACIIGVNSINAKRQAAIAAAYSLAEVTLKDYQEKVIETIGANKEEKIRGEVAQKHLDSNPCTQNYIIDTGKGEHLVYDVYSGRYFHSDIEKIRRVINDLNHDLLGVMWVPLNDLYYALGLPGVKMGDELGWTVDELIDVTFTSKLTDDGAPCLVMDYDLTPRYLKGQMWSGL